jgi:hypothetical protein
MVTRAGMRRRPGKQQQPECRHEACAQAVGYLAYLHFYPPSSRRAGRATEIHPPGLAFKCRERGAAHLSVLRHRAVVRGGITIARLPSALPPVGYVLNFPGSSNQAGLQILVLAIVVQIHIREQSSYNSRIGLP